MMRAKSRLSLLATTTTPTSSSPPPPSPLLPVTALRRHVPRDFGGPFQDGSLVVAMQDLSLLSLSLSLNIYLSSTLHSFFSLSSLDARLSFQLDPPAGRLLFRSCRTRRVPTTRRSRPRNSGNSNEEGYFAQSSVPEDFHEIPVSGCIEFLSPGQALLRISYRRPLLRRLFTSSRPFLFPLSFLPGGTSLLDCVSYGALYAPPCAPRDYELPQRCSRSSRVRYRNNSVCQVARKYTQRLYDRFDSPTLLTYDERSRRHCGKQYLATFREPGSLLGPFARVDTIPSGCSSELRIL